MEDFKDIKSNVDDNLMYELLSARRGGLNLEILKQDAISEKVYPDTDQYEEKFMIRYFSIKTNDPRGNITEIDITKYNELRENPFFQTHLLRWKISGAMRNIYKEGILQEIGVIEYNEKKFKNLRKKLPNLGEVVRSLTELYKN